MDLASERKEPANVSRQEAPGLPPFPVVGVGASAGGLEAFSQLLVRLSVDTGMAFVLVQHLDPKHASSLVELLRKTTRMPVSEVKEGMPVQANHVYVIPPNATMVLHHGALHLTPRNGGHGRQHMPIDGFFLSLAEEQRDRAVGVLLSGTGSDGMLGMKAIKGEGGITFAQDASAKYDGMPRSAISAGLVDFVLPADGIARELASISRHPFVNGEAGNAAEPAEHEEHDEREFNQLLGMLRKATAVNFTHYKKTTVMRRIHRRMVVHRLESLASYIAFLQDKPGELKDLCDDILIPVTNFFRDQETFEALKDVVFPAFAKSRPADLPIRLWSAGCSTGEEAYSLVIALLEFLGDRAGQTPVKIFATDVSDGVIARARAGVYPESITADVSPERLRRFFMQVPGGYQISKAVRDLCVFARHDVTRDPPFSQVDLISCRNLMIYLDATLQRHVLPVFHYALKPDGFLLLGGSETVGSLSDLYTPVDGKHRIYARRPGSSRTRFDYIARESGVRESSARGLGQALPLPGELDVQREADRLVLARFAPAGVVVNEALDIVQFRGKTGLYLEPASGSASFNLLKMTREGLLSDLRQAIEAARKEGIAIRKENVRVKTNDHFRKTALEVLPIAIPPSSERYFLVLFEDQEAAPAPVADVAVSVPEAAAGERGVAQIQQELDATRGYLQSIIEELEASNEELKAANEEIVSSNEELQSTNEELQTAKEELQATNEELTTVNDELRNRIEQATQLNDDLNNLLSSVHIPIVMLGQDLRIRRFTPSVSKLLNLIPGDVGRPIGDIRPRLGIADWEGWIREVIETLRVMEREVQDQEGHWHLLRIRPYRTGDHKIDGAVLALLDIDALKHSEILIQEALGYAESIIDTVREPLLVLDAQLRIKTANRSFYQAFRAGPEETLNQRIYDLGNGQWDIPALRGLLEEVLPRNSQFADFQVDHDFPAIGRRTMLLNGRRILRDGTKTPLILLAVEDVTAIREAEQHVMQQERLAGIGQMIAGLAHESRNALQRSQASLEMLAKEVKDHARALELVARIQKAQDDLLHLYDSVQQYAGPVNIQSGPCDLGAIAQEAWNALSEQRRGRDARFQLSPQSCVLKCDGDRQRLEQVFRNILENSLHACADPVTIAMNCFETHLDGQPALVVTLRNDGPPLTEDQSRRMFDAFYTTKTHGTGLGMTIVQRIIETHGGRIEVKSGNDRGVEFHITLPRGRS